MRAAIFGGLVMTSFAAFVFACGNDTKSTSTTPDSGTTTVTYPPSTNNYYDGSTSNTYSTTYMNCSVFPSSSPWNQDVTSFAADTTLSQRLSDFGDETIHLNFGTSNDGDGYIITTATDATPPIGFTANDTTLKAQFDIVTCPSGVTGDTCFPIPTSAKISNDYNNTVLFLSTTGTPSNCTVYEVANASTTGGKNSTLETEEQVDFASKWPLSAATFKTDQFRSASESGTSIFAGLLKREDVTKGTLTHALRLRMPNKYIRNAFVHPATHSSGTKTDTTIFPMGTRFRLKSTVNEALYTGDALVIVRGLKKYGVVLADPNRNNDGNDFIIDGEQNDTWTMDGTTGLREVLAQGTNALKITDFEVVNTSQTVTTQTN